MPDNTSRRNKRLSITLTVTAAAAILVIAGTITASTLLCSITDRNSILYVPEGTDFGTLVDSLSSGGKITNPARFAKVARMMKVDEKVRPGRYELRTGMNAKEIAGMLRAGNQRPLRVTFNNIRTMPQLAGTLGRQLMADSAAFASLLSNDSVAAAYGFTRAEFIGMFIPDTYEFYWTVTPEKFVERMHSEYERFWNADRLARLQRTGLTTKEVSTLASIIDEETIRTGEMPVIAGVYINRLKRGMPLQADPTVKFATGDFSLRRILYKHLDIDSPYNTYKHAGLPPGPIRMPSIAAIDAVLDYKEHDYLYFCAKPDFSGYHVFAHTLSEHTNNARAYSAALNKAGIR